MAARDARVNDEWMRTAAVQALLANCHKAKHTPPYDVYHFHPYVKRPPRQISAEELKALFGGDNVSQRH